MEDFEIDRNGILHRKGEIFAMKPAVLDPVAEDFVSTTDPRLLVEKFLAINACIAFGKDPSIVRDVCRPVWD